ncbi:MAG: polynucleotide adenylyltransferase PcnB [Polyangiaceae bacterium]
MRRPKDPSSDTHDPAAQHARKPTRYQDHDLDLPSFTVEEDEGEQSVAERHSGTGLVRHDVMLPEDRIDQDAARVVRRLERAGFQAYLVGGCVRDLLLSGKPKDFDVCTSARPEDVRGLFRNCRIIGRRFRLAHILFGGGKVVEVATFRRNPQTEIPLDARLDARQGGALDDDDVDDDLLIRSDNVFGDAHEDAIRRDFTINALFYDLDRRQVLDWTGGMSDIERRAIRTIGDPGVRFREDPIRILRAIKFAARLDLGIDPDVYDAMVGYRDDLAKAARPRVFEEILRLLRGGASHRSMWLLWETGVMSILMPELSSYIDDVGATENGASRFWRRLGALDQKTKERGKPLDDVVLIASLLREPLDEAREGAPDKVAATFEFLEPLVARIALPRRIADAVRRIVAIVPKLARANPQSLGRVARVDYLGAALDLWELDLIASGKKIDAVMAMRVELPESQTSAPSGRPPRRGRRRRNP